MLFNRTQPNKPNDSLQQLLEYSRKLVVDAENNEVNELPLWGQIYANMLRL
nr:hypothetical protein [Paenibacillus xylanexedens]